MKPEYLNMPVDELVADEAVQEYVLNGTDAQLWTPWLADHPTAASRVAEAGEVIRELHSALATEDTPAERAAADDLWQKVRTQTKPTARVVPLGERKHRSNWRRLATMSGIAAALLFVMYILVPDGQATSGQQLAYSTEIGETERVVLPDNSTVLLGPASALVVSNYDNERTVTLEGQAFFEVEKGKAFQVQTAQGVVEVLGTSFDVSASDDAFSVACATGKVAVTRESDRVLLTPGLGTIDSETGLMPAMQVDVSTIGAWRNDQLFYRKVPLAQIIDDLERYHPVHFELPAVLGQQRLEIQLPTQDLDATLAQLGFVLQVQLEEQQGIVRVAKPAE